MILATDIGYSFTKYAYVDNGVYVMNKIPTALARIGTAFNNIGESELYEYNGQQYNVGEKAFDSPLSIPTRTNDFLTTYSPLFLAKIIADRKIIPDTICVSLSIAEYKNKKQELKKTCEYFIINKKEYRQDVLVLAQGLGIWANAGKPKNALIVDIGYNTVDVLVIKDGVPSAEYSSGYTNKGTCIIASELSDRIKKDFNGKTLSDFEINDVLQTGVFMLNRKSYNMSDTINAAKKSYSKTILDMVLNDIKIKNIAERTNNLILAGGGALFIDEYIKEQYGIEIPDNPEYANVNGFLKLAQG